MMKGRWDSGTLGKCDRIAVKNGTEERRREQWYHRGEGSMEE